MPTYDYSCKNCHHAWEQEQRMVDDDIRKCPKCKKNSAEKQISASSGFILKGAGWYKDLYHKPSSPPPATEASASSAATKTESVTPSETKVEAKAETPAKESKKEAAPAKKAK